MPKRVNHCTVCRMVIWQTKYGWVHSAPTDYPHALTPEWEVDRAHPRRPVTLHSILEPAGTKDAQ